MTGLPTSRTVCAACSLSLLACAGAGGPPGATPGAPTTTATPASPVRRTLLQHADLPDQPGWESRLYLIEYPPGLTAPVHHHPVVGLGYVVRGSFESAFEHEPPVVVHEGESFTDRATASHTLFRNLDPDRPLTFVVAYIVRKGEPVIQTP